MPGHRGRLLLTKSLAKVASQPKSSETYYCFKCKFLSTNENHLMKHMTFQHLMGPAKKSAMERYIALSTPNLLLSTFHRDEQAEEESEQAGEESERAEEDSERAEEESERAEEESGQAEEEREQAAADNGDTFNQPSCFCVLIRSPG